MTTNARPTRTEARRKGTRLKFWVGIAAVAALGGFAGLAAANTKQTQRRVPTPAEQVSRLENHLGYPFFSPSQLTPPSIASGPPQVTSGGS